MMRPLRAFGGVLVILAAWLAWRTPVMLADYAQLTAPPAAPTESKIARTVLTPDPASSLVQIAFVAPPAVFNIVPRPIRLRLAPTVAPTPPSTPSTFTPAPTSVALSEPHPASTLLIAPLDDATEAYRALAGGDRRAASAAFRRALADTPDDLRAATWRTQLAAIEKRWSASAYAFVREGGSAGLAAAPVLGGGQSGAQIVYSLDPLAKRSVEIGARVTAPNASARDGSQVAIGLGWQVRPTLRLTAERLIGAGRDARSAWTIRTAGGMATSSSGVSWFDASIYGEAGAVGIRHTAVYGAVQGRVGRAIKVGDRINASGGAGVWASVQHDRTTVSRFELGPTIRARAGHFEVAADYRFRVAGNAAPGSGPALTLAAYF